MRGYDFTDTRVWLRDFWVYVYSLPRRPERGVDASEKRAAALAEIERLAIAADKMDRSDIGENI